MVFHGLGAGPERVRMGCGVGPLAVAGPRRSRWKTGRPRSDSGLREKTKMGWKQLWAEKNRRKEILFLFSENIFLKIK
jgi:hypothetical protein